MPSSTFCGMAWSRSMAFESTFWAKNFRTLPSTRWSWSTSAALISGYGNSSPSAMSPKNADFMNDSDVGMREHVMFAEAAAYC